jgi:hypothetical protein
LLVVFKENSLNDDTFYKPIDQKCSVKLT